MPRTINEWVQAQITLGQSHCASFAEEFKKSPDHALEWSSKTFEVAARLWVWRIVERVLNEPAPKTVSEIRQVFEREALNGARYPQHSTSVQSNAMHQNRTAAYAEIANELKAYEEEAPNEQQ